MAPCGSSTMTSTVVVENPRPSVSLLRLEKLAAVAESCKRLPPTLSVGASPRAQQSERPTKKRRKQVAFAPVTTKDVHTMEPHSQATWFNADDYAKFEDNVRGVIRILRNNTCSTPVTETPDFCIRGLEKYRTVRVHEEKKLREQCHLQAILQEQERQKNKHVRNVNVFRTLSRQNSKWSRDIALEQAKLDAKEVVAEVNTDSEWESDDSSCSDCGGESSF